MLLISCDRKDFNYGLKNNKVISLRLAQAHKHTYTQAHPERGRQGIVMKR